MTSGLLEPEVQDACKEIAGTVEAAYAFLLDRRETALTGALAPLDREAKLLTREYSSLSEARMNLVELLGAQERKAQFEHDNLLLSGDREGAAKKLAEQREAALAPEFMKTRQQAIDLRLVAIEKEKQVVARRAFDDWFASLQAVIRVMEHGLFVQVLDATKDEMYDFQTRHGLGPSLEQPFSGLVQPARLDNLTAGENSIEWKSGNRWYSGRRT